MKWSLKRDILAMVMILLAVVMSLYYQAVLPDTVPSHFDAQGIPDGFSATSTLVWLNIGIIVGIYLLLTSIPFIDPFWKKIQPKYHILLLFRDLAMVFMLFIALVNFISASVGQYQTHLFGAGFGLLFVVLGNYLPKLPRNFFFGIRSPWTLASEIVWKKTHILSGWLFVLSGAIIIILSLTRVPLLLTLLVILLPVVLFCGIIYPYFLYRKLQKEGGAKVPEL